MEEKQDMEIVVTTPFWLMPFKRFIKVKVMIEGREEPIFEQV